MTVKELLEKYMEGFKADLDKEVHDAVVIIDTKKEESEQQQEVIAQIAFIGCKNCLLDNLQIAMNRIAAAKTTRENLEDRHHRN